MRMRSFSLLISIVLAGTLMVPGITVAKQQEKPVLSEGTWTLAIYVDADNNLEMYWDSPSLEYLLQIPASDGLKIVAMVDRLSTEGTERIEISGDLWQVVETYPEMNFGDGETFGWFLSEVDEHYQSDHLVVIPWDHGSAWKGFCTDQTSGGDKISLEEMENAIIEAGVYIDILAFDACACSSMELAYQAARTGLVELLVASEDLVAGDGFPYDLMFTPVALDSIRTPQQVATDMLAGWKESYEPISWAWYCTLGIVDLKVVSQSIIAMSAWTDAMTEGLADYASNYRAAVRDSYYVSCGSHYQVDLIDLGRHLMADPVLSADATMMVALQTMVDAMELAVIDVYNPDRSAAAGGISVWWGSHNDAWRTQYELYSTLAFAQDSGWGNFLILYNEMTCGWVAA